MNDIQYRIIEQLRRQGYAIAVFYPEEIEGCDQRVVEERMVVAGNEVIRDVALSDEDE